MEEKKGRHDPYPLVLEGVHHTSLVWCELEFRICSVPFQAVTVMLFVYASICGVIAIVASVLDRNLPDGWVAIQQGVCIDEVPRYANE